MITIALTKGRVMQEVMPLLKKIGLEPLPNQNANALILETPIKGVRLLQLRGVDVPTYVDIGAADIGIVGKDLLLEYKHSDRLYELVDLKVSRCRLMAIRRQGDKRGIGKMNVATKYTNIARQYYAQQGIDVELIKLYGSMELAPILGVAEEIVDIVDTGKTIATHDLKSIDIIAESSVRVCVNPTSMRLKYKDIQQIIEAIQECL